MKIYIAGSDREDARYLYKMCITQGHEVVSTWHSMQTNIDNVETKLQSRKQRIKELLECNLLISLGGGEGTPRHFELGFATACDKRIIHVGGRDNLYHYGIRSVGCMNDLQQVLAAI